MDGVHFPEKFTKISKAPTSDLRLRGVSISGFLDNFLTKASSCSQCEKNVHDVVIKFIRLGFTIHPTKTQLVPKQEIISLSFVFSSRTMTTALPANKKAHLKNITLKRLTLLRLEGGRGGGTLYIYQPIWFQKTPALIGLRIKKSSIRFLAKVTETLVSTFPASENLVHFITEL